MSFTFPTLSKKMDSAKYGVRAEDPAVRSSLEGGYVYSRARFTRAPRKSFSVGYTLLTNADKVALESFWDSVAGGSEIFSWTNTENNVTYSVRFIAPLEFSYSGRGTTKRWDVQFELEEA